MKDTILMMQLKAVLQFNKTKFELPCSKKSTFLFLNIIIILLSCFSSQLIFSQDIDDETVYLDSLKNPTLTENFLYYRIIKGYYSMNTTFPIYDYFKSGELEMSGTVENRAATSKTGEFIIYYKNGNKKSTSNYKKSKLIGPFYSWYENGFPKMEAEYIENTTDFNNDLKINQFWNAENKQTVIIGNGYFEEKDGKSFSKGELKNGLKQGIWSGYVENQKIDYAENYLNGKFISGLSIDIDKIQHAYDILEIKPTPKNGIKNFYKFLEKNFKLSDEVESNNINGVIVATFIVEIDGTLDHIQITKSLSPSLDKEMIRVLKTSPKWIPGQKKGISTRNSYRIPLTISKNH